MLIAVLTVMAVLILLPALAMLVMMSMGHMMGTGGMMGPRSMGGMMGQAGPMMWPGWLMVISWLLLAIGIIVLLVWAIRRPADRETGVAEQAPLSILQRRYANGEIGPEEYERVRSDLLRDRNGG
jgi:uncharacterized membrane protein